MKRPEISIHNAQTNEIVTRVMSDEEFAQYQIDKAESAAKKAEIEAQTASKAALLDRLGITEDEAKLLLA